MFNLTIKKLLYPDSCLEKELIIGHAIKRDRVFVLSHPEFVLNIKQYLHFKYYLYLWHRGYSIAAITGHKEFFGLNFFVNKKVLIPRPETELLVMEAIDEIKSLSGKILLLDVGTGSGCIPISILKNIPTTITAWALDISVAALKVVSRNIKNHQVNIKLIKSNLFKNIAHQNYTEFENIIITANLPYLTNKQITKELSIQKEPKLALVASENGLALYKKLLKQTSNIFPNKKIIMLFEIDPDQSTHIIEIVKEHIPLAKIEIKKDLAQQDRLVKIST